MIIALILSFAAALAIKTEPGRASGPRMWASPASKSVNVYSPTAGPNERYNISIMVENMPNVLTVASSIKIDDFTHARIVNYYRGDIFNSTWGFTMFLEAYWDSDNSDLQEVTAAKTSAVTITNPVEVFKIELEVEAFAPSVLADIYYEYAGDIHAVSLLPGDDCLYDHTIYMTAVNTNTIVVDSAAYNVTTASNSTVSAVAIDLAGMALNFTTEGPDGTTGFVNVTIPKNLLTASLTGWSVMVDNVAVSPSITENATHTFIYLSYVQSTHNMRIVGTWVVPEFPSMTVLLTLLATMAIMIALIRKVHKKPRQTL